MPGISGQGGDRFSPHATADRQRLVRRLAFSGTLMTNPMAVVRTWSCGRCQVVDVNEGFARLFGVDPETILHDGTLALKNIVGLGHALRDSQKKETACYGQFRLRIDNTPECWVKLCATIEGKESDGSCIWRIIFIDNTESKVTNQLSVEEKDTLRRHFLEESFDGIVLLKSPSCAVAEANSAFAAMLGYSQEELLDMYPWDWDVRYSREQILEMGRGQGKEKYLLETRWRRKDGQLLDLEIGITLVRFREKTYFICVCRDLSQRNRTEAALRERDEFQAAMIEQAPAGVVLIDVESLGFSEFNDLACSMLGYTRDEFACLNLLDIKTESDREGVRSQMATLPKSGQVFFETMHRTKNGSLQDVQISARYVTFHNRGHFLSFWVDISEQKRAERELRAREQEVRTLVEHSPDTIIRYDRNLCRTYANPAAMKVLGKPKEAILGQSVRTGPVLDLDRYQASLEHVLQTGQPVDLEFAFKTGNGRKRWASTRCVPEFGGDGFVETVLVISRDITEIVRQREAMHKLAFYDTLTGLPNRALFRDRLRQEIAKQTRRKERFALLFLDLDNFKDINETLGHAEGDKVLKEVARRIGSCLREGDTLARLGGDEFGMLLPGIRSGQDMGRVAETILDRLDEPYQGADYEVYPTASIGIAIYPDDTRKVRRLLSFADLAMYHAKSTGRNTFQYHDGKIMEAVKRRLTISADLRNVLERDELELYFQPKVSMPEGRIVGAEALLRWNHPELGLLTPDTFIAIAEDSGGINEIGRWVLHQACAVLHQWNRGRESPIHMAVNLSGKQFKGGRLFDVVSEALAANECEGSWLELEITETIVLEDNPVIQTTLEAFRRMGISMAIDDFGTGYSALSYLNRFPVDVLKIDRSFIMDVEKDQRKAELVKAFIAVARALNMGLVAEGVELVEHSRFLCENGCTVAQGYLYSPPVPVHRFNKLLDVNFFSCCSRPES